MQTKRFLFSLLLLSALVPPGVNRADGAEPGSVSLWDTGKHSDQSLPPDAVAKREGWKEVADEKAGLTGDACLANDCLALVLRKGSPGAECYYRLGGNWVKGPTIIPVGAGGDKAKAMESFRLLDHTPDGFLVGSVSTTDSGKSIAERYFLKKGKPFVETAPGEGTEKIFIEMQSRHAVIPDVMGGDLVVTARDTKAPELRLPSENMLLNLTDNGNAIVQCVWRSGEQDAKLRLGGEGEERAITATEIAYKKDLDMHVWVAVLAAPGIWFPKKAGELGPVKLTKLDWTIPFPALWRADYRRTDGLTDSWKVVIKKEKEAEWDGFGINMKKDGSVLYHETRGVFGYPVYIDHGAACMRLTKFENLRDLKYDPEGTILVYPFQRTAASPKTAYGVVEVLKEALEDTPEFTRPDEIGVKLYPRCRYPGVCGTTAEVEKIFDAKEEQKKKREIIERFAKMNFFNVVIRMRIEEYMTWLKRTREFCARAKAAKPQLAPLADEMDGLLAKGEKTYTDLKLAERTPAAARVLTERFVALVDDPTLTGEKRIEAAKQLGRDSRTIGGTQDHSTGVFRMFAKEMRQRAGHRMMEAKDDDSFNFEKEVRKRTAEVLQNSVMVENRGFD